MDQELWHRNQPFMATMTSRELLGKPGSKKMTYHIVISLKGSGLRYNVGDSLGVWPINDPELINKTLRAMHADGKELVHDKQSGETTPLREFLTKKANLTDVSRKFLQEIEKRQTNSEKRNFYQHLLSNEGKETLKDYLELRELWDILEENPEVVFSTEELCALLMPLLPRFYSIASSQDVVGEEVHLTVALLNYEALGHPRKGVCTHFLCDLAPLGVACIPIFIHPHKGFTTPEDHSSHMIMVGPGTGVAPFRAFLQERHARNAKGRHWLFFGEWNKDYDFYYEDFWRELQEGGKLLLHTAFSRDQGEKVYVQDRMLEQGSEIFKWLEEGAVLYVCGDAKNMAKDVDAALLHIIKRYGHYNDEEAKAYVKNLRAQKRYLRDVY